MKIVHLLYSGLGGHGNVFFSMVSANQNTEIKFSAIFNGVEQLRTEYAIQCNLNNIDYQYVKKRKGIDIGFYFRLYRAIKKMKPSIILVHGSSSIFPVWLYKLFNKGIKKIAIRETQANHLKTLREWFWLAISMLISDRIVFLSNEYNDQIKSKFGWLYRKNKIVVIPNGIDLDLFKPIKKTFVNEFVFGMQSRLVSIKDHITMIAAFAQLVNNNPSKKLKLLIAGIGNQQRNLEKQVKQLGMEKHVKFVGLISEVEMPDFIHQLDVYIHSSFGETMSTAIMQAMACKKPIIASDVPGINNMIQHENTGLLVPVKDTGALHYAMIRLMGDQDLSINLATNAYNIAVDKFSNTLMLNQYKNLVFK